MTHIKSILITLSVLLSATLLFSGCEKDAGEGGRGSISGIVIEQRMQSYLNPEVQHEYPVAEERVYIIYGDDSQVYDDNMRTDFEGRYKFRYLREGTYTVYTYSECNIFDEGCQENGSVEVIKRVVELGKNEDVVLDDIVRQNY